LIQFNPIKKPIISDWLFLVAGKDQISNFLEGYELVVDLWKKG
jgi:hypothetical protein